MPRITIRMTTEDDTVHALPYDSLMEDFRDMFDAGDRWGSAMGPWFTVACELYWRGEDNPAHWEFRPGANVPDPRDHDDPWFAACEKADPDQLVRFGNFLHRYSRRLKLAGLDY